MARRALGIDIGERTIKAVLLTRGLWGGYRVAAWRTVDLSPEGGIAEGLQAIFAGDSFRGAAWASQLPVEAVSFRSLQLPFADARKIRQVLAFELEPLILSPIEDVYVDCLVNPEEGGARLFAAAVPRAVVDERIKDMAARAEGEGILECSAVPAVSALLAAGILKGGEILLDCGAGGTAAVFVNRGRIVQIRRYDFGGEGITRSISQDHCMPHAEAEEAKRTGAGGGAVEILCESFFAQLSQTMDSLRWNGDWDDPLSRIILTGGGALYGPLAQCIRDFFAVPVEYLDLARATGFSLQEDLRAGWQPLLMDQALALALRAWQRESGFDFVRVARKQREKGISRNVQKWAAAIAGIAFLLGAVDFTLDYRLTRLRLENEKRRVAATFRQYAPEVTRIVDPVQQLTVKLNEAKRLGKGMAGVHSGATLIGVLREISALVPPSAPLLIDSCLYEGDTLIIKGKTDNFDVVNAIKKDLEQSRLFTAVAIISSELMKKEGNVSFEMRVTIR